MAGFSSSTPVHLFHGAKIEMIIVGASSLQFALDEGRKLIFDYFGATEYRNSWLYHLPLCGEDSVQYLVGQTIEKISIESIDLAYFQFSGGKVLEIVHDDPVQDLMRFIIGETEYVA